MALQSALATVGVAKQTAKGSAASTATFGHGLTDGTIMSVEVDQSLEEHTSGVRTSAGVNRMSVVPAIDFSTRAHSKSTALWAYAALGAISTSGSSPYTHVCTLGSSLPYLTTFGTMAGNYYKIQDVKVDSLAFSFSNNEPLVTKVAGTGTALSVLAAVYTTTNDETNATYWTPIGGTFSVDVDGAGTAAATAKITQGEISISNNTDAVIVSGAVVPDDVVEGRQDVECSFDIIPNDLNLWRTIVTGSTSGTAAGSSVIYGTFSMQFANGSDTLTIAAARVAFTCDFPDADPSGGTVTLGLAGLAVSDSSNTTPLTVTVVNTNPTY